MDMVYETDLETAMTGHTIQCVSLYLCFINKPCLMKAPDKGNSRKVLIIIQFS